MMEKTQNKKASKKKKTSKVESVSIRKAEGGFVIDEYRDDYDDNKAHICTSKSAVTKLVNSLLG